MAVAATTELFHDQYIYCSSVLSLPPILGSLFVNFSADISLKAVFFIATALFCIIFANLAGVALDNHFMVRAFDTDESGKLYELFFMYSNNAWKPLTYLYGTAHTYLTLFLSHALSLFRPIAFFEVALIGRLVNFLSLLGTGFLFFRFGKAREYPKWFLLFIICLYFVAVNFRFSTNAKPEHLQAFFIVASVFCLQSYLRRSWKLPLFTAGLFCGLAFATKYAGALLIVFEAGCLVWFACTECCPRRNIKSLFAHLMLLGLGGVCGVALLGPYLLIDFAEVFSLLLFHSQVLSAGFVMLNQHFWYDWFRLLFSMQVLWWGVAAWLIPVCVWSFLVERPNWRVFPKSSVGILWVVCYLVYMCVAFRELSPRFLIVIVPFLLDFVFSRLGALDAWLQERGSKFASSLMFILVLICTSYSISSSWSIASEMLERPHSRRIEAGKWLADNVSLSNLIAYDFYTYVPPEFSKRYHQPYLSANEILVRQPVFLVISPIIMSRYLDFKMAEKYRGGKEAFMNHYYLYSKLKKNNFPGYHLVQDFGEVMIYQNSRFK